MSTPTTTDQRSIEIFDTTLRDGAQTQGVDFNPADKEFIARELDAIGIDYIECGWPGANPTDDAFFNAPPKLKRSRLTAFGMTRRPGRSAENDPGLSAILNVETDAVCMVGKSWDFHVEKALEIELEENVAMIADSVVAAKSKTGEVMYGEVPAGSVVVAGSMPSKNNVSLYCAVIVKRVDAKTRSKTSINDLLRD